MWLTVIVLSPLSDLDFYPYSEKFYWYMTFAVSAFLLGAAVSWAMWASGFVPTYEFHALRDAFAFSMRGSWMVNFYILAMAVALCLQAYNRAELVGDEWWTPVSVVFFRQLTTEEYLSPPLPWVSYLNFFFFSAVPLLACHKTTWLQRIAAGALLLVFIYFSSARASIFTIALIAYFFDWQKNGFRLKLTLSLLGVLLVAYFAIAELTGKVADAGEHFSLLSYALAPSHALDQILEGVRPDRPDAFYTFPFLHGTLYQLRIIGEQYGNPAFYLTPWATNVYTIFGPYILDYGESWSYVWLFAIGMLCEALFWAARTIDDSYLLFLNSLALTLLTLGVFHDHFTSSGYVWASIFLGFFFFPRNGVVSS